MASLSAVTTTQFDALDTNSDGFLSQAELEARVEVTTPGCTLSKQGVAQTLADKVEEFFLFSLTLLTLVAFGRRPQR